MADRIADTTRGNQEDSTNTSSIIFNLIPLYFALGIMSAIIGLIIKSLKHTGLL